MIFDFWGEGGRQQDLISRELEVLNETHKRKMGSER